MNEFAGKEKRNDCVFRLSCQSIYREEKTYFFFHLCIVCRLTPNNITKNQYFVQFHKIIYRFFTLLYHRPDNWCVGTLILREVTSIQSNRIGSCDIDKHLTKFNWLFVCAAPFPFFQCFMRWMMIKTKNSSEKRKFGYQFTLCGCFCLNMSSSSSSL